MTEREKVLKGLGCCAESKRKSCPTDCPFFSKCGIEEDWAFYPVIEAAFSLLKPKPVLNVAESVLRGAVVGKCPSCNETILSREDKPTKFCRYCGQEVTWG